MMRWLLLAPLFPLLLALLAPDFNLQMPWLLFGALWQLNEVSRALLAMTSLLWFCAGLYCFHAMADDPARRRFSLFWLLTLLGNLVLVVAQDIASFYTGFALMTFAGYGLVVHSDSADARHAGRVYLVMAVLGEMLILAGLILLLPVITEPMLFHVPMAIAASSQPLIISLCLLLGFGVKAGLLGVHMWLPLAHPVAPTPASAVLSGAMIKAGLLAWLHVLPLGSEVAGELTLPTFGWVVTGLGLTAALLAALAGAMQARSKAVLAYSSISQMGLMTALVGLGLVHPAAWPLLLPAIVIYIVHHGLAKGALFLSVGLAQHPGRWPASTPLLLALLPALALIGLPLTSGAAAKGAMKSALYQLPDLGLLTLAFTLVATATAVLMLRFLWLLQQTKRADDAHTQAQPSIQWAVALNVLAVIFAFWWLPLPQTPALLATLESGALFDATWTLLLALVLGGLACKLTPGWRLPAGDILWPVQRLLLIIGRLYPPLNRAGQWLAAQAKQSATRLYVTITRAASYYFSEQLSEHQLQRHIALIVAVLMLMGAATLLWI